MNIARIQPYFTFAHRSGRNARSTCRGFFTTTNWRRCNWVFINCYAPYFVTHSGKNRIKTHSRLR